MLKALKSILSFSNVIEAVGLIHLVLSEFNLDYARQLTRSTAKATVDDGCNSDKTKFFFFSFRFLYTATTESPS